jgi:guanosine-3',5'-bis(diphosphate) 3'-pyrophosphohydrolase
MEKKFEKLIQQNITRITQDEMDLIHKAWEFAKLAHGDQKRLTGELYISHPLEVASILSSWNLDSSTIIAGLLHDCVEDGGATRDDIVDGFGEEIALLVDGATKVANLKLKADSEERFVENLRKMVLYMAKDIRVVLVKLADRLHNMRTLDALPQAKQKRIARETLEIYAPLAERLGMGGVKGEIEDLSFPYLYPQEYARVFQEAKPYFRKGDVYITKMEHVLFRKLAVAGIRPSINGRKKHLYSLWKKLKRPEVDWDFGKIHDIVALRIIVDTTPQCYVALGIVHTSFKPVPSIGISDFIAQPKPNGYQSIHTKVFGPGGRVVEVQIRTHAMHEQAEHGIAAHWAYSEAKSHGVSGKKLEAGVEANKKLSWVKQLVAWQKEVKDAKEFIKAVKFDAFSQRNFVFSPKGDVYDLPNGATPVDFAYAVHTSLGQFISGAKVNGKMVPLRHKLTSGDVVEIVKSKIAKHPNPDWLEFVVTTMAKREIQKQLRKAY